MPSKPITPPAPRLTDATAALVVGAVAVAASAAGVLNEFAQDDLYLIQDNLRLHSLTHLRDIVATSFWPPPWSQDLYRPFTSLLLAVQYALGSGAPLFFRLTSIALYATVAIGLFHLARRLLPRPVALAAALLFAAHPVHVEAVALGVGQSELLVALFALIMVTRYFDRRRGEGLSPRDWGWLALLYLAASLSKEHGLVIPGLLLALELSLLAGPPRERLRTLFPGYLGLAAVAALVVLLRRAVLDGNIAGTFTAEALDGVSPGGRALTMLAVVPRWARLLLWPAHLQADYSPQELLASTGFGVMESLGAAILLAGIATAWLTRRRAPVVTFGLCWVAVALFPVSNLLIPTGILLAERTLFLASAGLLLAVGGLAAMVWPTGAPGTDPGWRRAELVCVLLVVAGVARSASRYRDWRSEAWYAVRGVQDAPRSFRMRRAYGDLLFELGQRELAIAAYQEAIALAPRGHAWQVRNDFARRFRVLGESGPELEQLRLSLGERPDQEETRGWAVAAALALGRYAEAAAAADTALARGGKPAVFSRLRRLADSAARAGAPPGSVRIGIVTEGSVPLRPPQ